MRFTDARTLPPEAQADLRRRVVAAVNGGMTQQEAARVFGISRRAVGVWVRAHRAGGPSALDPRRRGRSPGDPAALSRRHQAELLHDLRDGCPDDFGLDAPLWSRRVLAVHIERRYGLRLAPSTVGAYLTRWGLVTPGGWRAPVELPPSAGDRGTEAPLLRLRRSAPVDWVHLTWSRPTPRSVSDALLPGPGAVARGPIPGRTGPPPRHLDVLTAYTGRGVAHFRCMGTEQPLDALRDLGGRLTDLCGHPLFIVVHGWPADDLGVLQAWIEDPTPLLDVVVAERVIREARRSAGAALRRTPSSISA